MFKKAMGGGGREKRIRRREKVAKGGFAIRAAASTLHFCPLEHLHINKLRLKFPPPKIVNESFVALLLIFLS